MRRSMEVNARRGRVKFAWQGKRLASFGHHKDLKKRDETHGTWASRLLFNSNKKVPDHDTRDFKGITEVTHVYILLEIKLMEISSKGKNYMQNATVESGPIQIPLYSTPRLLFPP